MVNYNLYLNDDYRLNYFMHLDKSEFRFKPKLAEELINELKGGQDE